MKNLFDEFKPATYNDWIAQLQKDLKDKTLDDLISFPEKDLEIKAYYHPQENKFKSANPSPANDVLRSTNEWLIRKEYSTETNASLLADLNDGINAISLQAKNQSALDELTKGVLFEHICADVKFDTLKSATETKTPKQCLLNFDVISLNQKMGENKFSLEDFYSFFQKNNNHKTIWVDGFNYGNAGATTVQELAFTLAHLNEYIQFLVDKKEDLNVIEEKITVELSVNENYFVNLSKFRAIRELISLLLSAYGATGEQLKSTTIYAKTNLRHLTINDSNNNLLRQTTQAMSAVLGGCNVLTVSTLNNEPEQNRLAKNIQLILKEESYFDKVVDPAAGSYFIEDLTNQLIEKSWTLFQEIETNGGLIESLKKNKIQNLIAENQQHYIAQLNANQKTFLGINKFQSKLEQWQEVESPQKKQGKEFEPLVPFQLENYFTQKNLAK